MEKTIEKLKFRFLNNKVNQIINEIKFREDYVNISIDNLQKKKNRLIENKYLDYQDEILPYADKDYVNKLKEESITDIENKYYWQRRKLNQKLKRAQNKGKVELEKKITNDLSNLEENKKLEIKEVQDKYFDYQDIPQDFQTKIAIKKQEFESFKQSIDESINKRIEKIRINTINKINQLQANLEIKKAEMDGLDNNELDQVMDENIILKLNNLCMYFGGLKAVEDLSFEVKKGEIFGLIGPNGAGKTTIFNCITRFYKPTHGEAYYRNHENKVILLNDYKVHQVIKQGIVRTFQNVELIWELPILDNLLVAGHSLYQTSFFSHLINSRRLRQEEDVVLNKAKKILTDLNLLQYQYHIPLGLPYGVLKRIELARTLMIDPQLIILDEPAAGLNEAETTELAKLIKKIRDEYQTTIFLVEHDMGLVMNICDTVCAISFGKKLAIGRPEEIQNNKLVQDAYLGGE